MGFSNTLASYAYVDPHVMCKQQGSLYICLLIFSFKFNVVIIVLL